MLIAVSTGNHTYHAKKYEHGYRKNDDIYFVTIKEPLDEQEAHDIVINIIFKNTYSHLVLTHPDTLIPALVKSWPPKANYKGFTFREIGNLDSVKLIASLLSQESLNHITFNNCQLNDASVETIAKAIRTRQRPIALHLPNNQLTDVGAEILLNLFQTQPFLISELNLYQNRLTSKSYNALAALAGQDNQLTFLAFGRENSHRYDSTECQIDETALKTLLIGLKNNKTLTRLQLGCVVNNLQDNPFFHKTILSCNHTLKSITLTTFDESNFYSSFYILFCTLLETSSVTEIALSVSKAIDNGTTYNAIEDITKYLANVIDRFCELHLALGTRKPIEKEYFIACLRKVKTFYNIHITDQLEGNKIIPNYIGGLNDQVEFITQRNHNLKDMHDQLKQLLETIDAVFKESTLHLNQIISTSTLLGNAMILAQKLQRERIPGTYKTIGQYYLAHAEFLFLFDDCFKDALKKLSIQSHYLEKITLILNLTDNCYLKQLPRERVLLALAQCHVPLGHYLKDTVNLDDSDQESINLVSHLLYELLGGNAVTVKSLGWQELEQENPERFKQLIEEIETIQAKTVDDVVAWLTAKNQALPSSASSATTLEHDLSSTNSSLGQWIAQQGLAGIKRSREQMQALNQTSTCSNRQVL